MAHEDCASSPFQYVPCSPFLVTKAAPPLRHVPDVDHLRRKASSDAEDSPFAIPRMRSVPCTPKFPTPKPTRPENNQCKQAQETLSPVPQDQEVPSTPAGNQIAGKTFTEASADSSQGTPGQQSASIRELRHSSRKNSVGGKPSPGTKEIDLFSGENDFFA